MPPLDPARAGGTVAIAPPESGTDITAAARAAIAAAHAQGGGVVAVPPGDWTSGGLRLLDGVRLHLPAGARLRAAPGWERYADTAVDSIAEDSDRGFITASGARDIGIGGQGLLVGDSAQWRVPGAGSLGTHLPAERRPRMIVFEDCERVEIADIGIEDSPMWTIHLVGCRRAVVRNVEIRNDKRMPNTDGINLDGCADARVEGCFISAADDGICLKTTRRDKARLRPCERIVVTGCVVESESCALKIGTETWADIRDVVFADCVVAASNRAFGIFSRDGGVIERIRVSGVTVDCHQTPEGFWGCGEPVTITIARRHPGIEPGPVQDVVIDGLSGRAQGAVVLVGLPDRPVGPVTLADIDLRQTVGRLDPVGHYDLRPTTADLAPEPGQEGRKNAWVRGADGRIVGLVPYEGGMPALYARHVDDLGLSQIRLRRPTLLPPGWNRAAMVLRHVTLTPDQAPDSRS